MNQPVRYHVTKAMQLICEKLDVSPAVLLRKAGLPPDFLNLGNIPIAGRPFYDLWEALAGEADRKDLPIKLASGALEGGFDSAAYAFSCSPNVRVGVQRKAMLKPLLLPLQMEITEENSQFSVAFHSGVPGRSLPALIGWFELAYFTSAMREATGVHIVPKRVTAPVAWAEWAGQEGFFGVPVTRGPEFQFTLDATDADLPLTSRNDALWAQIENGLRDRLAGLPPALPTSARVRDALIEGLPAGVATADAIGRRLGLSKRSLQRRLGEEDTSFKAVLEQTRRALALNYLHGTDVSVQEIAFLLGFRDTSSFFRAFRSWTGTTPMAMRSRSEGLRA